VVRQRLPAGGSNSKCTLRGLRRDLTALRLHMKRSKAAVGTARAQVWEENCQCIRTDQDGARDAYEQGPILAPAKGQERCHDSEMAKGRHVRCLRRSNTTALTRQRRQNRVCAGIQEETRPFILASGRRERAFRAGVKFGPMGSADHYTHVWAREQNTRELGWFVKAGLPPEQGCARQRRMPRTWLGRAGTEPLRGYYAACSRCRTSAEISNVVCAQVRWVMKGGGWL